VVDGAPHRVGGPARLGDQLADGRLAASANPVGGVSQPNAHDSRIAWPVDLHNQRSGRVVLLAYTGRDPGE
jgi:hypothetical protein